jgi:hypothetical protein
VKQLNLGTAKTKALQYMREYSNNANLISSTVNADYTLAFNNAADTAQKKIATIKKIISTYSFSRNPILNQLGLLTGFDIQQHLNVDLIDTMAIGSQAYYFEVDRQCSVYIEEQVGGVWTILSTITVPNTVISFTAYKGLITPSSLLNQVRIRFGGLYPYNIRNRYLCQYTFPTVADIPDYTNYVEYTMPNNFMKLKSVIHRGDPNVYEHISNHYWRGKRILVVRYDIAGSFDIEYYQYPADITASTDDNYVFELDIDACEAIPYFMGAMALIEENPSVSTMLLNLYQAELSNLDQLDTGVATMVLSLNPWGSVI